MPFLFFAVVHFFFHSFIWQLQKEGSLKRKLFAVYIHRLEPLMFRSSRSGVFCKNMFLKISRNSQKSTSVGVSFLVAVSGLRHLGTPTQVFSCELCVMFKTPVAIENLRLLLRNVRQRCQWDTKKKIPWFSLEQLHSQKCSLKFLGIYFDFVFLISARQSTKPSNETILW